MSSPSQIAPIGGVLVASASSTLREQVLHSFHERSWPVQEAKGGAEALCKLETGVWQLLFLDRKLPDLDAEELLQIIKRRFPGIEVVFLDTDNGQLRPGQRWLATAPQPSSGHAAFASPDIGSSAVAASVVPPSEFSPENKPAEPRPLQGSATLPGMITVAESMHRVFRYARMVAPCMTTVLITGPTGTGKELVARALHQLSPRAGRPFVVVNCAAIPESLLESELFGHVRGAFTGAVQTQAGRILAAQGGTLFLDEVGELSLPLQAKLLRFLDQKEVQKLGSMEILRADVRVVAATNADLGQMVDEKKIRGDLYYRLAAFPLELPPLSERREDIVPLAEHFLRLFRPGPQTPHLAAATKQILRAQRWAGNVRELQQVMERAVILACGDTEITPAHLYLPVARRRQEFAGGLAGEDFAGNDPMGKDCRWGIS
ncbi:MAG TPA: sigma-54 dependent transcriptional regulator [Terriglobales bacterium]|jgi:DNA-binding NtrC family response regulator